jgi:twitching motility protein PilT
MAGIDALLKVLVANEGDELVLRLGQAPRLLKDGAQLRYFFPDISESMHAHLFAGVLDETCKAELEKNGSSQRSYASAELGEYRVTFRGPTGGDVRLVRVASNNAAQAPTTKPAPQPVTQEQKQPGDVEAMLEEASSMGASDLHLAVGEAPVVRVDGRLQPMHAGTVTDVSLIAWMNAEQREHLSVHRSIDATLTLPSGTRVRVNIYRADGGLAGAFRILRRAAPTLKSLHLPHQVDGLAHFPDGLVLFCGPTGSGKSTTMAALVRSALEMRGGLLITIEDPIEYGFAAPQTALVRQRQIGRDVKDLPTALRDALREDPDILLIGEMRDPETIQLALTAAETGHLVFASLHSRTAASAVERICDTYGPQRQQQIRTQLADALRAVVSQRLLPRAHGGGRVPAVEVLKVTAGVAHQIREGKTAQIQSSIQTGAANDMVTMERSIETLLERGVISHNTAQLNSKNHT